VLEENCPVARVVLVEGNALVWMTEKLCQELLALFERRAPQVLAIEFEQVERAEHGGGVVTVPADQVENGEAGFVADDGLAVDQDFCVKCGRFAAFGYGVRLREGRPGGAEPVRACQSAATRSDAPATPAS
jgi:hypothetical protein